MWRKVNEYYEENGSWTLTKPGKPELYPTPYGLHHEGKNYGYFETHALALIAYEELSAPVKPSAMPSKSTSRDR